MADKLESAEPATTSEAAEPARLPDDHPLVTAYARLKETNAALTAREAEAAANAANATNQRNAGNAALAELRAENATLKEQAFKGGLAAEHGLTAAQAGALAGTEAQMRAQAEQYAAANQFAPRAPAPNPDLGRVVTTDGTTDEQFAATMRRLAR